MYLGFPADRHSSPANPAWPTHPTAARLSKRFFRLAIVLHLATALGLYLLAYYEVTVLGYLAAVAALALTFLRPLQRGYEHLSAKLRSLSEQIRYPREDVAELRNRVAQLEDEVRQLQHTLNAAEPDTWAHGQAAALARLQGQFERTDAQLESFAQLNRKEHEALARQSAAEIAKLSEDAQFLNRVIAPN